MEAEEIIFIYKKITAKIKYNESENIGDLFEKCSVQLKKIKMKSILYIMVN